MRMQTWIEQAVRYAVRDVTTHNEGFQKKVRSKFIEFIGIAVPVVDDACEEPVSRVSVKLKDV